MMVKFQRVRSFVRWLVQCSVTMAMIATETVTNLRMVFYLCISRASDRVTDAKPSESEAKIALTSLHSKVKLLQHKDDASDFFPADQL